MSSNEFLSADKSYVNFSLSNFFASMQLRNVKSFSAKHFPSPCLNRLGNGFSFVKHTRYLTPRFNGLITLSLSLRPLLDRKKGGISFLKLVSVTNCIFFLTKQRSFKNRSLSSLILDRQEGEIQGIVSRPSRNVDSLKEVGVSRHLPPLLQSKKRLSCVFICVVRCVVRSVIDCLRDNSLLSIWWEAFHEASFDFITSYYSISLSVTLIYLFWSPPSSRVQSGSCR